MEQISSYSSTKIVRTTEHRADWWSMCTVLYMANIPGAPKQEVEVLKLLVINISLTSYGGPAWKRRIAKSLLSAQGVCK